ncbi:MAG TPA: hypothetical protein DCO86_04410 [Spirochaetaceae bacterium]|nr:hypothetical protein [Spirochaetaceae bacterium]
MSSPRRTDWAACFRRAAFFYCSALLKTSESEYAGRLSGRKADRKASENVLRRNRLRIVLKPILKKPPKKTLIYGEKKMGVIYGRA